MSDKKNKITLEYDLNVTECPCGSKKKPEKCCGPVKPRIYSAEMDSVNYHESEGFAIGLDYQLKRVVNNKVKPLIGEVQYSQKYKRDKGDKVIVQGPSNGDYVMSPESILLDYDDIYFVDTNTKNTVKHKISMTGVIHAFIEKLEKDICRLIYTPLTVLEFWDPEIESETIGWYALICAILEMPDNTNREILLVVDSRLDDLKGLSNGVTPLFDDFYIPENISLIYASADVGTNVANKLIKMADKLATNKLNEVLIDPREGLLKETVYPCQWFRQWTHDS